MTTALIFFLILLSITIFMFLFLAVDAALWNRRCNKQRKAYTDFLAERARQDEWSDYWWEKWAHCTKGAPNIGEPETTEEP